MKYTEKQKGSLYLTVILLGIVLAIAIGVTGIVVTGSNLVKGLGDSVRAYHIAESGVEESLYTLRRTLAVPPLNVECSDDFKTYGVSACSAGITQSGSIITIKATGSYNGSQRRIEAVY
jgi:hypothetical protein